MEMTSSRYEWLDGFSLFVFDLDDTLYNEKDYLYSGYWNIAHYLAERFENTKAQEYYTFLREEFEHNGRNNLFDRLLLHFDLHVPIEILLDILHNQQANIQLDKDAAELLNLLLMKKKKVYILTNGNICQQKNKVKLLDIAHIYPEIKVIYASQIMPKPLPLSLHLILELERIEGKDAIMIGDSQVDEETARNAKMNFSYIQNVLK